MQGDKRCNHLAIVKPGGKFGADAPILGLFQNDKCFIMIYEHNDNPRNLKCLECLLSNLLKFSFRYNHLKGVVSEAGALPRNRIAPEVLDQDIDERV